MNAYQQTTGSFFNLGRSLYIPLISYTRVILLYTILIMVYYADSTGTEAIQIARVALLVCGLIMFYQAINPNLSIVPRRFYVVASLMFILASSAENHKFCVVGGSFFCVSSSVKHDTTPSDNVPLLANVKTHERSNDAPLSDNVPLPQEKLVSRAVDDTVGNGYKVYIFTHAKQIGRARILAEGLKKAGYETFIEGSSLRESIVQLTPGSARVLYTSLGSRTLDDLISVVAKSGSGLLFVNDPRSTNLSKGDVQIFVFG